MRSFKNISGICFLLIALFTMSCQNEDVTGVVKQDTPPHLTATYNFPSDLRYTDDHEWVRLINDSTAEVGITEYRLTISGPIVQAGDYESGDIDTGRKKKKKKIVGTLLATNGPVPTTMPFEAYHVGNNTTVLSNVSLINSNPYQSWIIKVSGFSMLDFDSLMSSTQYSAFIGQ